MSAKMKAEMLGIDGVAKTDRWWVTNGTTSVGPIGLGLIARGIETGKVPLEAFVRHDSWKVWRPLADFAVVVEPDMNEPVTDDTPLPRFTLAISADGTAIETLLDDSGIFEDADRVGSVFDEDSFARSSSGASSDDAARVASLLPLPIELVGANDVCDVDVDLDAFDGESWGDSERFGLESWADSSEDALTTAVAPRVDAAGLEKLRTETAHAERTGADKAGVELAADGEVVEGSDGLDVRSEPRHEPLAVDATPPELTDDIIAPARPLRADERLPEDALAGAADLQDALLLTLAGAVELTRSDAGILHRVDESGAQIVCAHGPDKLAMLGTRTRLLDPSLVAAAADNMVIVEPTPGPAGEAILERLRRLGIEAEGAAMVPIRPAGRLLALLELGRGSRYCLAELAQVERLVHALTREVEAKGWSP